MQELDVYASNLTEMLAALPAWAYVLLTAALLLVALWFVLRSQRHYDAQQYEQEHEQRQHADIQALRSEVYLPAAEAIARAQQFLAKFPGRDWTREEGAVVVDYVNGALGKLQVVANEHTIRATSALANEFSISYLTLTGRQRPMRDIEQEIEHLDSKISHMSYERDQLLGHITRAAGEGLEGQGMWNDLNLRFDKLHRQIAAALDERAAKLAARNQLRHELAFQAARCSLKLAKLAVPAYLAIRAELQMPIDEDEYRSLAHSNIGELEHAVSRLSTKNVPTAPAAPPGGRPAAAAAPAKGEERSEAAHERNLRMVLKRGS